MSQPDMNAILAQAQQMQAQLAAAQDEIVASSVVGDAANGLVKVTMMGSGEVTDVAIDPRVVDPEDVDGLQDLILGAIQDATRRVQELAEEKMGPLQQAFGGLGDGMPNLGL